MALTESNTITEISFILLEGIVQVKWRNTIEKDGAIISQQDHYKLYSAEQKEEFLAEVENAETYLTILGW